MAENGTATFANPDDYQAGIGDAGVNLIVTGGGDFKARLTWLRLRRFHVLRGCENLPRIAFISLSPVQVFVSFPTSEGPSLTYSGLGLQFGDVVFHSRGERTHQRTNGESQWGLISLPPEQLAACSKALTGLKIAAPPIGRVLRPSRSAAVRLLRLHSRACHLAETRHKLISHPEVARALRAGIASRACQLPDGRRCQRQSKNEAAPRRYHGSVRGCVDRASWPTAEHARALLGGRCARTNLASVLHRIPGHESDPVPFAAAIEHGALGIAACRPGNSKRR
jgi:hypothetical protein